MATVRVVNAGGRRKTDGKQDHFIVVLSDCKQFASFVMCYAEQEEDDFIFEHNEEFSIVVNSSPQWFAFDDVDRAIKMGTQKAFKAQDVTGFLEVKQTNKALSLLSSLFSQKNQWPRRYCVIQGFKFYIYEGDKFNKPIKVVELSRDFRVKEVRRGEANGKQHVLSIVPGKG